MEDSEWRLRCQLSACHHLFHHFGWTDVIWTHLSVRLPQNKNQYLITPYGLMFEEVTASKLVKVDFEGKIIPKRPRPLRNTLKHCCGTCTDSWEAREGSGPAKTRFLRCFDRFLKFRKVFRMRISNKAAYYCSKRRD